MVTNKLLLVDNIIFNAHFTFLAYCYESGNICYIK